MYFFYNITHYIFKFFLNIVMLFNKKVRLFVVGRKKLFKQLNAKFSQNDDVIWFHCASLGEFEQGRPIMEKFKRQNPKFKILLTFFSPSGYEVKKDYAIADVVSYLPLDTKYNARKFIEIVNPKIAIFVKYEFWPNFLRELKRKNIKTILVSGIFRKEQSFFKNYGSWMKKALKTFDHFFVQNKNSKALLKQIGYTNATVSGDTRFDRVDDISKLDNTLEFAEQFVDNTTTLVAGSTWSKDEELLVNYINKKADSNQKFIIAPHNIHVNKIVKLKVSISKKTVLYSDINGKDLSSYQVLIIDTIGLLTKIYSYADIAYVGGGFGAGIHNILEPATFGVPIVIGPNYQKFNEAKEMVNLKACAVITNNSEFNNELNTLFVNSENRKNKGKIAKSYIIDNIGATGIIVDYLNKNIVKKE
ncbi:MAG: 3-deoxy-D-manno-octulosonic acid transferase [Flavobacteriaceae bacterium]|nr:3-deoxy-D-manno-octulosonic acid transferase [Flavobacteriaceae bacterium]